MTWANRRQIIALAARHRLPAIYWHRGYVLDGGLLSYGEDEAEVPRRLAVFLDKILKGAKPDSVPVEQPTRVELVINLKYRPNTRHHVPSVDPGTRRPASGVNTRRSPRRAMEDDPMTRHPATTLLALILAVLAGAAPGVGPSPVAADRQTFSEAEYVGFGKPAPSIIPRDFEFYWAPPSYAYDPARARKLLAEAGFPRGFDAGEVATDAVFAPEAEAMINGLHAIGIRTRLRAMERAAFYKADQEKQFKNLVRVGSAAAGNAATRIEGR